MATFAAHLFNTIIKRDLIFAYASLVGICIIWGTTFLVMRIGVAQFPPFLFAGIRQTMAGIILCSFLFAFRSAKLPSWETIRRQSLAGLLMVTVGNGFVSWAEVYVPSGVAAIICSLMPLWVTIINVVFTKSEKADTMVISGILIGLAGILIVFSENLADFANVNYQLGIALILIASAGWAIGSVIIKRNKQQSEPFLNAGIQMLCGGLFCFVFSVLVDDLTNVKFHTSTVLSLTYLIVMGSTIAFALYTYVLIKLPITIASLYSYVNPIVAVVLGWLILDERLNPKIGVAILITLLGIYLVNRAYQRKLKV